MSICVAQERIFVRNGKKESFFPSVEERKLINHAENLFEKWEYEELENFVFASWSPAHSFRVSSECHLYLANLTISLGLQLGIIEMEKDS